MSDVSPLITIDELAEVLRVNRKTAYALVQQGGVPGVHRFGRAIRVHRETVLGWLAGQDSGPRERRTP